MTRHIITRLQHGRRWYRAWTMAISKYLSVRHQGSVLTGSGWVDAEL